MNRRALLIGASSFFVLPSCSSENGMNFIKVPIGKTWFYASSDYFKIEDVRRPMGLQDALSVVGDQGCRLPTKEEVDAIWKHADLKLEPTPMTPGPSMSSPDYWERHNELIEDQIGGRHWNLLAGHKKDILQPRSNTDNRVTIYGWHRLNGRVIQPVSRAHSSSYFDYSHGVRLVRW